MITEKIYSPINDQKIRQNLQNSPIWNECYHEDEIADINKQLYCYSIKFEGLLPIQVTKITKPKFYKNDKKRKRNTDKNKK
jgi:hypothetical protein